MHPLIIITSLFVHQPLCQIVVPAVSWDTTTRHHSQLLFLSSGPDGTTIANGHVGESHETRTLVPQIILPFSRLTSTDLAQAPPWFRPEAV